MRCKFNVQKSRSGKWISIFNLFMTFFLTNFLMNFLDDFFLTNFFYEFLRRIFFDDFFWRIFWRILTKKNWRSLTKKFDEFFDEFFWRINLWKFNKLVENRSRVSRTKLKSIFFILDNWCSKRFRWRVYTEGHNKLFKIIIVRALLQGPRNCTIELFREYNCNDTVLT